VLLCGLFSSPAAAADGSGCFSDIASCFQSAALSDSFWQRTWQALDCELEFVRCIRILILGQ
jgi:hypothetical protein